MNGKDRNHNLGNNIDIGLAVAETFIVRGEITSHRDIAEICGCSPGRIQQIEYEAKKRFCEKARTLLSELQS